jgi:hypothetical protein
MSPTCAPPESLLDWSDIDQRPEMRNGLSYLMPLQQRAK